jgi:hypothetical protein
MHPGRILGIIMGLVILIGVFVLPINTAQYTLYDTVQPLLEGIGDIQNLPTQEMIFCYILIISFILLVIAGVVGYFPLGTGVLGIVGMAMLSLAPYFLSLNITWAAGFYVIWIASIVALGASFWHGRTKQQQSQVVQVNVQPPTQPPPSQTPSQPPQSSTIIVSPTISVKTGTPTEETERTQSSSLETELIKGTSYTSEEAMKMFLTLKERTENLQDEKGRVTLNKLQFKDVSNRIWKIDIQTGKWVFNDGKKWVEATPPSILEIA